MVTDLLQSGSAWLDARLQESAAGPVTYKRQGRSVTFNATMGSTEVQAQDAGGVIVNQTLTDWLFPASLLVLGGAQTLPQDGDQIIHAGPDNAVYEVTPIGSEPCWRYTDANRLHLRVHTKRTNTRPA